MERDVAIRIDGMLSGALAYMDGIAHLMGIIYLMKSIDLL